MQNKQTYQWINKKLGKPKKHKLNLVIKVIQKITLQVKNHQTFFVRVAMVTYKNTQAHKPSTLHSTIAA
jgi:hypothetical protein